MKVLAQLARKIRLSIGLGIVKMVNDARKIQSVQVTLLNAEVRDANRYQDYGFTSNPLPGAECVTAAVGGNRSHTVIIRCDDGRYRMKDLEPGEVAIYTDEGDFIQLKRGREIVVTSGTKVTAIAPLIVWQASTKVRAETPTFECTGEIKDRCDSDGKTMEQMRTVFDAHAHQNVQNGLGTTAGPTPTIG